jgi:hypothetical protein
MRARFLATFVALATIFGLAGPAPEAGAITGHPTPTNVGVQGSTTAYTGPYTITSCGTVIDHKSIVNHDLMIRAGNGHDDEAHPCVTITNSIIYGGIIDDGYTGQGYGPLLMNDSTVINLTTRDVACVSDTRLYMHRDYVSGCRSGVQTDGYTSLTDNYLLADRESGSAHMDGFITNGMYGTPLMLQNNTFECNATLGDPVPNGAGCAADAAIYPDFSAESGVNVWGNLFKASQGGMYYCFHSPYEAGKPTYGTAGRNNIIVGNDFESGSSGKCGNSNAVYDWNNVAGLWCNNTFTATGADVHPSTPDNC